MDKEEQKLRLAILNVEEITSGTLNTYTFDYLGGSIGSSSTDAWQIKENSKPTVKPNHLRIEFIDGRFCIREVQGDVFLNESISKLGKRKVTVLNDGDSFLVGKYKVRALFINDQNSDPNDVLGQMSLEEVVEKSGSDNSTNIVDQFIDSVETNPVIKNKKIDQSNIDVLELHEMSKSERNMVDPLLALEESVEKEKNITHFDTVDETKDKKEVLETQQDLGASTSASFSDKGIPTDDFSEIESELRRMEGESETSLEANTNNSPDLQISTTGDSKTNSVGSMTEDKEESLRVAISGLKMLYAKKQKKGIKPALSSIPLQPIEDNPIRLDHSLDETLELFYSGKVSPVFLSAPAAIKESLDNIKHDQLATDKAIDEALQELLHALSPKTLVQRFQRYATKNDIENSDAWAWQMYGHYYNELMTGRQNGFNRLFQELFSQSYDREMRQLQRKSELGEIE